MRLLFLFMLGIVGMARAEVVQELSLNNASPDEIIQKLKAVEPPPAVASKEQKPIQVGTLVSLKHKGNDTPFYDFTIALTDGRVVTVSDANHLALKPGDMIILTGSEQFWQIKDKISQ